MSEIGKEIQLHLVAVDCVCVVLKFDNNMRIFNKLSLIEIRIETRIISDFSGIAIV